MEDFTNIEEVFGKNAFTFGKMKEMLPKDVFEEVQHVADFGGELSKKTADIVANARVGG